MTRTFPHNTQGEGSQASELQRQHIPDSNRELPLLYRMGCIYLHVDLQMEYFKRFCFAGDT